MFPDKNFIKLKEHNDYLIALKILASYSRDDLINALSIAYVQLPYEEQLYVSSELRKMLYTVISLINLKITLVCFPELSKKQRF